MTTPTLQVTGLKVGYGGRAILPPVDFAVSPGELWVLAGANGSGKSTLIKTLVGLQPPLEGQCLRPPARELAYLPQRLHVDPMVPMRAIDLVRMGIEREWSFLRPWMSASDREQVTTAMRDANCLNLARESYQTLSEGQKQRVLLARALASSPSLLLMDEPTSAMDLPAQQQTLIQLDHLRRERPLAILLISHHLEQALSVADHVLFLDASRQTVVAGPTRTVINDPAFCHRFPGLAEHLALPPICAENEND
ncbi:MAG: metal ABC transporter ATP-binding protein [Candidatus Sericytochromatia bacterium]|nr:metal ABC transporter ATP-binding protein [Candidatus Sericytochromatia bacterium]